jgi:hypothetical protein
MPPAFTQHTFNSGVYPLRMRRMRDIVSNRLRFLPPELANPQAIFDPLPFRSHPPMPVPVRIRRR